MALVPITVRSQPGIKRDGTRFDSTFYVDGQWVRFQRGLPRKIGGFITINRFGSDISRGMIAFAQDDRTYIYTAGASHLETLSMDLNGNTTQIINRTPTGFVDNVLNAWQFDIMVDTSNVPPSSQIIAQVAPNNQYLANSVGGKVYIGALNGTGPLTDITTILNNNYISATGGITVLFPYLVVFGNDGSVGWSAPGNPTQFNPYTITNYPAGFNTSTALSITDQVVATTGNTTGVLTKGSQISFDTTGTKTFYTIFNSIYDGGTPGNTFTILTSPVVAAYPTNTPITLQTQVLTGAGNARVANQKIVAGMPLRGGPGSSPSGLLWSLDAVLTMTFTGGDTVFSFNTISPDSSILSAACAIEYDGVYYWVGSDRFLLFNGVVRELQNDLNINFFFDNINRAYASRVFAFKVPKYSEIWWCFPFGTSTECNHAVIYNIRENAWYDTKLPNGGRSAAVFLATFGRPIMSGVDAYQLPVPYGQPASPITYRLWQHETGADEVDITNVYSVQSYFETAPFNLPSQQGGKLKSLRVAVVEPDFVQVGNMTLTITGEANAKSYTVTGDPDTFPAIPIEPQDEVCFFKEQRRILRFRFESNVTGGDYQMGKIVAHIEETDSTYLGSTSAINN